MKTCTKCRTTKLESEFFMQNAAKQILHTECKVCYALHRKNYAKQHYIKYGDLYRERAKQRNYNKRTDYRAFMAMYLVNRSCLDCGENDPIVLELDHRDPETKSFTVSQMAKYNKSIQQLSDEVDKCDVVCANCHKKRTAKQFGWHKAGTIEV